MVSAHDGPAAALVRSELRALVQARRTGRPASFQRPSSAAFVGADAANRTIGPDRFTGRGGHVEVARSTFRRSRVHRVGRGASLAERLHDSDQLRQRPQSAPAQQRSAPNLATSGGDSGGELRRRLEMASAQQQRLEMASAQQQSAPAAQRSTPDLDTSLDDDASSASIAWHRERSSEVWASASSYDPLKRSHFPGELSGTGSVTQLGAGISASGASATASQDSIGRSSGVPPRQRRRRRSSGAEDAIARADEADERWRTPVGRRAMATEQAEELAEEEEGQEDSDATDELLPDEEMQDSGLPVPAELLTIRPEYADDLSKVTNSDLYAQFIRFLAHGWPGWSAPKGDSPQEASRSRSTDAPDPRRVAEEENGAWRRVEESARWLDGLEPRSRLDSYPMYVLCRELLRQLMRLEMEYHDARNVALSDLVKGLRADLAELAAAKARDAEEAAAELAASEARRHAAADSADASQTRLKALLAEAEAETERLEEALAQETARRLEAEEEVKTLVYDGEKAEQAAEKAAEAAEHKIASLESILADPNQLRNAMRRMASDGTDDAGRKALFVEGAVALLGPSDRALAASTAGDVFKGLGDGLPLGSMDDAPWKELGDKQRTGLAKLLLSGCKVPAVLAARGLSPTTALAALLAQEDGEERPALTVGELFTVVEGLDGGLDKLRELLSAEEAAAEAEAEPAAEASD